MADTKQAKLILSVQTEGADKAAASVKQIQSSAVTLQGELAKIGRADTIGQLAVKYGIVAKKTKDATSAAQQLNEELKKINATESEISGAAGTFAQTAGSGNRLARIGSELRALPSTQIPGLGIGTDQVASILRLSGALGQVSEKVGVVTTVATALTPALGATAAGITGIAVAAAPFVIALIGIGLALKALSDQAAAEAETINSIIDAQRSVAQDIANGLTTDEAEEKLATLNAQRKEEADLLAKNQQIYRENIENQGALTAVIKATSGAEQALNDQIATSTGLLEGYDTSINALTKATQDGSLAANDAAEAEIKLAEERSKAALTSADNAARQLQAEQKALAATEEQNQKRLTTIEDERAVIEKQIEVLTASGLTSEEVTAKIAGLNDQLGLLGKESTFIKDTALEQSRVRDAETKAKKDSEDAAKKAQQAQEQYTKAVQSAKTAYIQSIQDIGTRLTQTLADNRTKFDRDLIGLTVKNQQDEYDLQVKANRAERDAALDQIDDLDKLRKDARKSEQEALREGDFKQLYLSRESAKEAATEQQDELNKERERRALSQRDALEDLRLNFERQRNLRKQGYEYSNIDAQTAQQRELRQAMLTRQRALQVASEGMNAELRLRQNFWNAAVNQTQNALNQITGMQGRGPNMPTNGPKAFSFTAGLAKVIGT
jgi:hypothetical protein